LHKNHITKGKKFVHFAILTNDELYGIIILPREREVITMNFTNTNTALSALKGADIKISQTKNGEAIHQTTRNKIGAILRNALFADLKEIFPVTDNAEDIVCYLTADGIILEVPNESVKDGVTNPNGSGAISLEIGFTVKSLEYNARDMSDAYAVDLAEKEAKKREADEKKAKKIAKDTATRAKKG
jgi:hypothetical protein